MINMLNIKTDLPEASATFNYLKLNMRGSEMLFSINELFEQNGVVGKSDIFDIFGRLFMDKGYRVSANLPERDREILKLLLNATNKEEFIDKLKLIKSMKTELQEEKNLSIDFF